MGPSANVRAISSLEDLKGALGRFGGEAQEALQAAEQEIRHTLEWLQERVYHWQREVERRQREVDTVRQAYEACMDAASASRGATTVTCAPLAVALRAAEARLARAVAELENTRRWKVRVEQAVAQYHAQSQRLQNLATGHAEKAQAFLGKKIGDLEQYMALASGGAVFGPAFLNVVRHQYETVIDRLRHQGVQLAKLQEMELVYKTGRGTRDWRKSELGQPKSRRLQKFPKGYYGHHINNVSRFPELAANPDNIMFVTWKEHYQLHHRDWHNNTSGRMFNRKSLMVQWTRYK